MSLSLTSLKSEDENKEDDAEDDGDEDGGGMLLSASSEAEEDEKKRRMKAGLGFLDAICRARALVAICKALDAIRFRGHGFPATSFLLHRFRPCSPI